MSMKKLCIPYISLIEFRENVIISLPIDSWIHITFFYIAFDSPMLLCFNIISLPWTSWAQIWDAAFF
jgi:hypothetical protein